MQVSHINIHGTAEKENDPALEELLEHDLMSAQIELIRETSDYATELVRAGPDGLGLYVFDRQLRH